MPGPEITDPFGYLGLPEPSGTEAILDARRRLAKSAHPDTGGSVESMQRLNAAVDAALSWQPKPNSARAPRPAPGPPRRDDVRRDHPSFTIEVLPAEAFEGLLIAARWLGSTIADDPPYVLDVEMSSPTPAWCRLELVPDAGSTTVSLTTARLGDADRPDIDQVRDRWIAALNQVDWAVLEPTQPPPS